MLRQHTKAPGLTRPVSGPVPGCSVSLQLLPAQRPSNRWHYRQRQGGVFLASALAHGAQQGHSANGHLPHPDHDSHSHCSHDHDHEHHHHHHHHNHDHDHDHHHHFPETPVSRLLEKVGILGLAESMSLSTTCTVLAISCYTASLILSISAVQQLAPVWASTLQTATLSASLVLLGIPQLVESVCLAAAGVIDTHVLMALAAFGTLYMGMAQEGALLLLLFSLSHILEEKFTAQAQGSLRRLFDNIPDQAVVVELDDQGTPLMFSSKTLPARDIPVGSVILVKPGEEVPLDGRVVWGSASVSQQHISGESMPVKVTQGAEVAAGSLNLDGLLALKSTAGIDDSTPARIARMAAQAQADKPRLSRLLDAVTSVWSKAVVGVTAVTLAVLLSMGVPLWEPGGALYRAMGVLTAGSPCAVVLVPLAYVCAIATITRKGVLVRSGAALDALLSCTTVALDKTGTITSGALSLTQAQVITLSTPPPDPSTSPTNTPPQITMQRLTSLQRSSTVSAPAISNAGVDSCASQGRDASPECQVSEAFGRQALAYAVALSRASNHPVSRAMVQAGERGADDMQDVGVSDFTQVPGMGVQGICQMMTLDVSASVSRSSAEPDGEPVAVHFGSLEFIRSVVPRDSPYQKQLDRLVHQQASTSGARASAAVLVTPLPPSYTHHSAVRPTPSPSPPPPQPTHTSPSHTHTTEAATAGPAAPASAGPVAARARAGSVSFRGAVQDSQAGVSGAQGLATFDSSQVPTTFHRDGSVTYDFSKTPAYRSVPSTQSVPTPAAAPAPVTTRTDTHAQATSNSNGGHSNHTLATSSNSTTAYSNGSVSTSNGANSVGTTLTTHTDNESISEAVTAAWGSGGAGVGDSDSRMQLALFSFDDAVAPGAAQAVASLRTGRWRRPGDGPKHKSYDADKKQVIMLTGDHARVAAQVANTVGIDSWRAGMKPENKLEYVKSFGAIQPGTRGLVMVGDGINDAPALAAARVGIAVASKPSDMVAAAADFIILNGQGVSNLPWLFAMARKTHSIIKQNLILALTAVVFATLPTVAGVLPLWLAVLVHEGSTLLVALNSLRLLLDPRANSIPSILKAGGQAVRDMFAHMQLSEREGSHSHDHTDTHKSSAVNGAVGQTTAAEQIAVGSNGSHSSVSVTSHSSQEEQQSAQRAAESPVTLRPSFG